MKNNILISFVVPIYNVKKYLSYCLDSVVYQMEDDCEIILVDDGSTDGCKEICDEYKAKYSYITVIHKENGGLVSARKAGLKVASGKYIACLDSDDWIDSNYIKRIKKEIIKSNPDIICFNYYTNSDSENKKIFFSDSFYKKIEIVNQIFPKLIQKNDFTYFPPAIWAKVFKKDLVYDIQMSVNDKTKIGEDIACVIPCIYNATTISLISDCLYHYRLNDSSMTKGHKVYDWCGPKYVVENLMKYIDFGKYDFNDQLNRFITHQFIMIAKTCFYSKKRYDIIKNEIMMTRNDSFYKKPIDNAETKGNILAFFAVLCVKNNLIFPLYLYSRIG